MKRLKGPDLKMPPLKVPDFLADLYYDLRDRRLLPLVALVLVAIVATPFLLGQKSDRTLPPLGAGPIAALKKEGRRTSELTVVEARPGLRRYQKRLRGRTPTDPFRTTGSGGGEKGESGGSGSGGSESSTTSTSLTSESTTASSGSGKSTSATNGSPEGGSSHEGGSGGGKGGSGNGGEGGSGSGTGTGAAGGQLPHGTTFAYAADVTIVHSSGSEAEGNKKSDPPERRKRVLPPAALPGGNQDAVLVYIGVNSKTKRAVFLVSSGVTGVFGEGKCAAGKTVCQVIELEPGFPEVFQYGEGTDRYSIKVTKLEPVVTGHV
jgi:hypothetical protein